MAVLNIHSEIKSGEANQLDLVFLGLDGTSFQTVNDFIKSIPEDDTAIDLSIHSNGGSVIEGVAIYDAIRASGKEVSATVEGSADSIASVILLSAPKENRKMRPNASMVIHNPSVEVWALSSGGVSADELKSWADSLEQAKERILDIYVDRTGTDRQVLSDLMDKETNLTAIKAKELGFISEIIAPNTNKTKSKIMANSKLSAAIAAIKNLVNSVVDETGDDAIVNMTLVTEAGVELVIERESGDPQVGDAASPDGEHTLDDGTVIVVLDGKITEIRGAGEDTEDSTDEITNLKQRISDLEAENAQLKGSTLTKDQRTILNKVSKLGGIQVLDKLESNYTPPKREAAPAKPKENPKNSIADAAKAKVEAIRASRQK